MSVPFVETEAKAACGSTDPHIFHTHEWIDMHFKNQWVWCEGLCPWCFPFKNQNPHGAGEHK